MTDQWQDATVQLPLTTRAIAKRKKTAQKILVIFERPIWIKQRDKVPSKLPAFLNALLFQYVLLVMSRCFPSLTDVFSQTVMSDTHLCLPCAEGVWRGRCAWLVCLNTGNLGQESSPSNVV